MILICSGCRSNVTVPAGHSGATIRCGICWGEVSVERSLAEDAAAEPAAMTGRVVSKAVDRFSRLPGKAVKGMEPLEDLLRNVSFKVPHMLVATVEPELKPAPAAMPDPPRPLPPRKAEDGLRRKRGTQSRGAEPEAVPVFIVTKIALLLLVAAVVFIAGYFLLR